MTTTEPLDATLESSILGHLPLEILLEILLSVCASSQAGYCALTSVSKQLRQLLHQDGLRVVPVTLEEISQLHAFKCFLSAYPGIGQEVRYLWIMDRGYARGTGFVEPIILACNRVVSLACSTKTLGVICSQPTLEHVHCKELTLVEPWHRWMTLLPHPHTAQFCNQITHLRVSSGLGPDFNTAHFANLTHLAFSTSPIVEFMERHLAHLEPLQHLTMLVVTVFWWREQINGSASLEAAKLDDRIAILQCEKESDWSELNIWVECVSGGLGVWGRARRAQRQMRIMNKVVRNRVLPRKRAVALDGQYL
ncbi:hypothetical protein BDN72DRAFT_847967 [Pluteus cervinus]|uniref:Uncharacterized protein n=1 Tax=Pluteus cervinus TaxID=181527 RepID=A0ACD3ABL7_9AGAR|nr:hypothetical protein BDN72DRAFT_847967 [Pluteus cervinus]